MAKPSSTARGGPQIDFVCFEVPATYVVGFGLAAGQPHRNLPFIAVLTDPTSER